MLQNACVFIHHIIKRHSTALPFNGGTNSWTQTQHCQLARRCYMIIIIINLVLGSAHVKDILSHTSMPNFSVNTALMCFLPEHDFFLQILSYGVNPALYQASRPLLCGNHLPVHNFFVSLKSSIYKMYPNHPGLLSLIINSNFCKPSSPWPPHFGLHSSNIHHWNPSCNNTYDATIINDTDL